MNTRIPESIAIIMDGNGRWARQRGLPRSMGHQEGVESVRRITTACSRLGVKYLTLYAFSTENWRRPQAEVAALMALVLSAMEEELFMKNNVRLRVVGDLPRLPQEVREGILALQQRTAGNSGLTLVIALSYSSKWEITEAVRDLCREVQAGRLSPDQVDEDAIAQRLSTHFMTDPDLLIRTGGELRLSNYLLWQCAYSELYFTPTYWPDFREPQLQEALADYQRRERRYGMTTEQIASAPDKRLLKNES